MNFDPWRLIMFIAAIVFILIGALADGFGGVRWRLFAKWCIGLGIVILLFWPYFADIISGRTK